MHGSFKKRKSEDVVFISRGPLVSLDLQDELAHQVHL